MSIKVFSIPSLLIIFSRWSLFTLKKSNRSRTSAIFFSTATVTLVLATNLTLAFNGGTPIQSGDNVPWWFYPAWVSTEILLCFSFVLFILTTLCDVLDRDDFKFQIILFGTVTAVSVCIFLGMFFLCSPGNC